MFPKLTSIAILVVVLVVAGRAPASVINGGFETGDLTGWTASPSTLVDVVGSAPKLGEAGTWTPQEGAFFALLTTGDNGVYTLLSQSFNAGLGEVLSFDVFFDANDELPFNDDGYVKLIDLSDNSETTLYSKSVAGVGDFGSSGWDSVSHSFTSAGLFRIEAGLRNFGDSGEVGFNSALGLDDVRVAADPVIPEPTSLALMVCGGIGLAGGAIRRRRARTSEMV